MKMYYLPLLFIGLITILCPNLTNAQIVKWDLTSVPSSTGDGGASDVFKVATTINGNLKTDNQNNLNHLRRGAGLKNTSTNVSVTPNVTTRLSLAGGFASTSSFSGGTYASALTNDVYYGFSVSAKEDNYLHCNSLIATIRRSGASASNGVQWAYRIVDEEDLADIEDPTYNTSNPFKVIGGAITSNYYNGDGGLLNTTSIDIEELKNVPSDKTVFFRLYIWGFSNANTNTFAVRSTTGSTAFSLEGTVNGTLPVELKSFKAKSVSQGVELAWQTVSENNNSHFDVLKISGQKAEKIGEVKGAGNSQSIKNYSFLDAKPTPGVNYYQLRQVDLNGDQSLSEIVSSKAGFDNSDLVAFANANQVTISTSAAVNGTAEVVLNDLSGKLLLKKKVSLNAGKNSFSFPVSLAKGTYIATVYSPENGKIAQKFIY